MKIGQMHVIAMYTVVIEEKKCDCGKNPCQHETGQQRIICETREEALKQAIDASLQRTYPECVYTNPHKGLDALIASGNVYDTLTERNLPLNKLEKLWKLVCDRDFDPVRIE
jgi:hypothetical protein